MAYWKEYRISDVVKEINSEKFVLPVIQRHFVWGEEKIVALFDTLLKGDSFGGIMVIEEERDSKPLFSFHNFIKDFTTDRSDAVSVDVERLVRDQYFVIDGQQRLQSFYIGLCGTMNGKSLYFDLFSDYKLEYEFRFSASETDKKALPPRAMQSEDRPSEHCWYPVKTLFEELKRGVSSTVIKRGIIERLNIYDEDEKRLVEDNIEAFCYNVMAIDALGLALVRVNKNENDIDNRQRMVELFRRLNDAGTKLSGLDLIASILKGFDRRMESFIDQIPKDFSDIGLDQDNLVKTIFILQDNHTSKEASITAQDASFAVENSNRIRCCLLALRKFLHASGLYNYYNGSNRSFIPLHFILYHLFYLKQLNNSDVEKYFDNHEVNADVPIIKKWLYLSLINGLFRGSGAGWHPNTTGVRKLLEELKRAKGKSFPADEIIKMYMDYGLAFTTEIESSKLAGFDDLFVYYLMYNKEQTIRQQDVDHIIPKSRLVNRYSQEQIYNICNYELIDSGTNRWQKSATEYKVWVDTCIKDKQDYIRRHLIPPDENLWNEDNYEDFLLARGKLIVEKIHENGI
jgi:hypothetical protein